MKRRRPNPKRWSWVTPWATPIMVGVAYGTFAFTTRSTEETADYWPLLLALYLVLTVAWVLIVRAYGRNMTTRAEIAARYTGMHPPEGVWAEYDGERFENLPIDYVGIEYGCEVYEFMAPKTARPPDAIGATAMHDRTMLRVHVGPNPEEDL